MGEIWGWTTPDFPHFYYMLGGNLGSLLYGDVSVMPINLTVVYYLHVHAHADIPNVYTAELSEVPQLMVYYHIPSNHNLTSFYLDTQKVQTVPKLTTITSNRSTASELPVFNYWGVERNTL